MRLDYVLSEVGTGLRRNLTMTIAVILTVAISLTFLGVAWLMRSQITTTKNFWYGNIEVSVFLKPDVTQPERDSIRTTLEGLPQVQYVHYVSKQEAFQRAKVLFKGSPQLLRNVHEGVLPESYLVKLKDPHKYAIVQSAVQSMPGVDEVVTASGQLKKLFRFVDGIQFAALVVAGVVLLAAVLLIFNTVRVAAFNRRRETGIMRLVGASMLFVQGPFVLEVSTAGLIGAAVSLGLVSLIKVVFIDHGIASLAPSVTPYIGWGTVFATFPWLAVVGVLLSAVTSVATLQRYLRV